MPNNQVTGKTGEDLACDFLIKQGYQIIQRNFKARYGEIDIIAKIKGILVFLEVKTRYSDFYGSPEEAITARKLREVIKTAQYYLHINKLNVNWRIDAIAITFDSTTQTHSLKHLENITL